MHKRGTIGGLAAAAAALAALQLGTSGSAQAFDGPNGHHQFVQISTRGLPNWIAAMDLLDENGRLVYHWAHGENGWALGGKETWWFTAGTGAKAYVYVAAADGIGLTKNELTKDFTYGPGAPDGQCFHINPGGSVSYTGDSATGGCTPD
jgi:hypothetical protein